jgi:hypothetical protein
MRNPELEPFMESRNGALGVLAATHRHRRGGVRLEPPVKLEQIASLALLVATVGLVIAIVVGLVM